MAHASGQRIQIPFKRYLDLLAAYLRPQWPGVAMLAVLLISTIALQLINPLILRRFIDHVAAGGDSGVLTDLAVLFLAIALVNQLVSVGAAYVSERVAWSATNSLRADLTSHCLHLDMSFHTEHTPGEMIERIDGDVTVLANFFSQFVVQVLANALLMCGVLLVVFTVDWRAGLVLTLFTMVALVTSDRIRNLAVPHWAGARQASAQLFGYIEERLGGMEDIRANGAVAYVVSRLYPLLRQRLRSERRAVMMFTAFLSTTRSLFTIGIAAAFAVGAYLWSTGSLTIGAVYLLYQYTALLRNPLEQILLQIDDLQRATASISRIEELYHSEPRVQDGPGAAVQSGPAAVELEDVSFGYALDLLALHDISFRLTPGRVVGVIGRTGSGKTTLSRLLYRLYDPTGGSVRLDGVDLRQYRLDQISRRVAVVTQDVQLLRASLRENIRFFDPAIADEQIIAALDRVGLGDWLRTLSHGLETELDAGGGGLSAGEAQLLAFTRVFLKDPGLVILDEASSRLDPATEARIEHAIGALLSGRTAIIIAHRLQTLQRADEIMLIEHGVIREHALREQLAGDSTSRFYALLHADVPALQGGLA